MSERINCDLCGKCISKLSLPKHRGSKICLNYNRLPSLKASCKNCGKLVLKSNMSAHMKTRLCKSGGMRKREETIRKNRQKLFAPSVKTLKRLSL